ncbi:uncharacterized protein LOC116768879 [Danaus plexippus]|uniref:uncharacterized protein LOC116768879 n=1 Tax=Danaus plexippus TaxID=13037 RepID=UPI002AB01686|nr:uncharacterized protein LOC116768879 [Danaus plexippus]
MSGLWMCATGFVLVLSIAIQIEAVTVNPLCPTNKIAPHRRARRFRNSQPRTFYAYYDLLRPGGSYNAPSSLQEKPQEDSEDCGEIEDYDENDVSSATTTRAGNPTSNRKYGFYNHYGFYRPMQTTTAPKRQTRPPAGGYFGNNAYNPPKPLNPTAYLKPVHEAGHEPHMTYKPGLVGGPSGHIIGLHQVKPTRAHLESTTHKKKYDNHVHDSTIRTNRHTNKNKPNGDPGIIASFIDLFSK